MFYFLKKNLIEKSDDFDYEKYSKINTFDADKKELTNFFLKNLGKLNITKFKKKGSNENLTKAVPGTGILS
jgi:hypothetical protein